MSIDQNDFKTNIRQWLEENAPPGVRDLPPGQESMCWGGRKWTFASEDQRLWLERAADCGLTAPDWPRDYGGAGLDRDQIKLLDRELQRLNIRKPLEGMGLYMLGPAILKYGTEAQKLAHLPPIARGEVRWAQGYSEPGAGSDLASVTTRCEDMGDHYLVNGSKIWTSYGDKSDWIFTLVRSDPHAPKHQGISFLLIDMNSPGVTVTPIRLISGISHFTATFFDNVRVPKGNLLGAPGQGWEIAKYLLQHERGSIGEMRSMTSLGDDLVSQRALERLGPEAIAADPGLRAQIVDHEIANWGFAMLLERCGDQTKARQADPVAPSVLKLLVSELIQRQSELMVEILGAEGIASDSPAAMDWLISPSGRIAGGSSEIQLNIIAKRALGLPEY